MAVTLVGTAEIIDVIKIVRYDNSGYKAFTWVSFDGKDMPEEERLIYPILIWGQKARLFADSFQKGDLFEITSGSWKSGSYESMKGKHISGPVIQVEQWDYCKEDHIRAKTDHFEY